MAAPGKMRVAILISGRGSNMAALIEASLREDCPYEVALVVSNVPDAAGLDYAAAHGVPQFAVSHPSAFSRFRTLEQGSTLLFPKYPSSS